MFSLSELVDNLHVDRTDTYSFVGQTLAMPMPNVFGGQVLAQALNAASRTVDSNRTAHSMHAYFLRPGNKRNPIVYEVDPIRDGFSFATRRVVAKQNGKAIFNTSISFQKTQDGFFHQMDMPSDIPAPETLERDIDKTLTAMERYPNVPAILMFTGGAFDMRSVTEDTSFKSIITEPNQGFWLKSLEPLDDNPITHQSLLAFMSDLRLMGTGLRPHPVSFLDKGFRGASLDHSIWFHTQFRVDDWLFYQMDSPRAAHSRNFNRGSIYTKDGCYVVSCAQEGLMRLR